MLPHHLCPYCGVKNIGVGHQCNSCGVRYTVHDRERLSYPEVFDDLDPNIEDEKKLLESREKNLGWICECGIYNMSLPKDESKRGNITCGGCPQPYVEGVNLLPLASLDGFGIVGKGKKQLAIMKKTLHLLQIALIKARALDSEQGTKNTLENCHQLIDKIESVKQRAKIVRKKTGAKDIRTLNRFLESYIGEDGIEESQRKTVAKVKRRTAHIVDPHTLTGNEKTGWILGCIATAGLGVALYFGLQEQEYSIKVEEQFSISSLSVKEKRWLQREYTLRQWAPVYDGDYTGERPDSNDIVYREVSLRDDGASIEQYRSDKNSYPSDEFRDRGTSITYGSDITVETGETYTYHPIVVCPVEEVEEDYDYDSYVPDGGSSPTWDDYTPQETDDEDEGGLEFGTGGAIEETRLSPEIPSWYNNIKWESLDPIMLLVGTAQAEIIEEGGVCYDDDKEEIGEYTIEAPRKYETGEYSVWDFGSPKIVQNRVTGNTPSYADYPENENKQILDYLPPRYYISTELPNGTTNRTEISNPEDWNSFAALEECAITKRRTAYWMRGFSEADLQGCVE